MAISPTTMGILFSPRERMEKMHTLEMATGM